MEIGNGAELEKVGRFCYLGDMLDTEGDVDLAVAARVKYAHITDLRVRACVSLRGDKHRTKRQSRSGSNK
jgi:hypothetical protein